MGVMPVLFFLTMACPKGLVWLKKWRLLVVTFFLIFALTGCVGSGENNEGLNPVEPSVDLPKQNATTENKIYYRDKAIVLMYHHLSPGEESSSTISPDKFKSHLDMLKEENFNVISLGDLGRFMEGKAKLPPNAVIITFDDGYRSNYEYAFPALKEHDFPATIFMIVSRIGRTTGEIPKLSWDEMLLMQEHKIDFQSHSYDGHFTVKVNAEGDEKPVLVGEKHDGVTGDKESPDARQLRVYEDLKLSKTLLEEKLGKPVEYFAVPYGWMDAELTKAANDAGLKYLLSIKSGVNVKRTDPNRIFRINAGSPDIDSEKLKKLILKEAK